MSEEFRSVVKDEGYCFNIARNIGNLAQSPFLTNEKKPYLDRFIELKAKYEKAMEIYNAAEKEVFLFVLDQEEGSHKSDKEAPAVLTRKEIVTL
ncbi:hypothetical protein P8452_17265 [Trifolium repens]|nr:hypothetical protein P8452_17265 [Trifolium repens]